MVLRTVRAILGIATLAVSRTTRDDDSGVRARAMWALGQAGSQRSAAFLIDGLTDPEADVRKGAAESLGSQRALALEALPHLISALHDPDEEIRALSAWALGNSGSPRAVPALVNALDDDSAVVRNSTVGALAELGPNALEAVPALVEMTRDPSVEVRRTVAASMKRFASPHIVPPLRQLLDDPDAGVRRNAIDTLSSLDPNIFDHHTALFDAIESPDPYVRLQAATAMGRDVSGRWGSQLAEALDDPYAGVRIAAIRALSSLGPSATHAVDGLLRSLRSEDVEIRRAAAAALGSIGSAEAIAGLVEALQDVDADVVLNSLYSLSAFPEIPVEQGRTIVGRLKTADPKIRSAAIGMIYQMGMVHDRFA